jgi:hypothetical protein
MYIEAVVVCVNYSDFLAYTLPASRSQFDNMVVVTDTKDADTVSVCSKYNVRCIQTDAFYADGKGFNKAAGINAGLQALNRTGWVVHLDADIMLPPMTRHILGKTPLSQAKIYGIDRLMCKSCGDWLEYAESPRSVHEGWAFTHLNLFSVGSRLVQYGEYMDEGVPDGWVPIGFFQMWHPSTTDTHTYPGEHAAADRTDVLHAKRYKREDRELIPELVAIHLESEAAEMGANWSGRKTVKFSHKKESAGPVAQTINATRVRFRGWLYWLLVWLRKLFPPKNHY